MKSISLILIFLHMIWKSIAIIYSLRGTTLLRLITIKQRGHDALHRYQIEWRSLTFDNITLSNHLFSMDNWCVMFYNINSINIERTILWMKNIIFTLSFDQVTWKSTEGLKVRLTDSGKTVYLLLYKGERYVYHKFAIYRLILRDSWPGKRKHILKMYITTVVSRVSRLTKLTFTSRKVFTT